MLEKEKYQKFAAICGMASPIIFTLMWIIGGFLHPGYSHIAHDISELLAIGAPNKLLLDLINISTSILNIVFFSFLHKSINEGRGSFFGPFFLLVSAVIGLSTAIFFPLDEGGEIITYSGEMHVFTVMLMALFSILGMIALWLRFRKIDGWKGYDSYTLITLIVTTALSIISAIFIESEIMGLLERLSVYAILQYNFVIAFRVYKTI